VVIVILILTINFGAYSDGILSSLLTNSSTDLETCLFTLAFQVLGTP
jgi:hypothetical protein